MYNPFHNIPSGPEAASAKLKSSKSMRPSKTRYHANNPLYHRFPMLRRIQEAFLWKFYQRLPILDHIPTRGHVGFGLLYIAILLAIFIYLFINGYNNAKDGYYLSPLEGDSADENCEMIAARNTGVFYGTVTGHWERYAGFTYAEAAYRLTLSSFGENLAYYDRTFSVIYDALAVIGGMAKYMDLGKNIMFWMGVSFSTDATNSQRLNLVGTPAQVMNRQFHRASLGAFNESCMAASTTYFDSNSAVLNIDFDISEFTAQSHCSTIMDPATFGYDYFSKPKNFQLQLDMRTLISVVVVNNGMANLDTMVHVPALDKTVYLSTGGVTLYAYYNPNYAGMSPLFCSLSKLCFLEIGGVLVLPFFHHAGMELDYPTRCDCMALNPADLQDRMHPCHAFRFISGFYYWPGEASIAPVLEMVEMYTKPIYFHESGFEASFIASSFGRQSNSSALANAAFQKKAFSFCHSPTYGDCSVFSVASFDLYDRGFSISEFYFQLERGACRDSFTPNATAWKMLLVDIFAPLYQEYQKCHYDRRSLVVNQAGITIGNLQLIGPFCVLLILLLGYIYRYLFFHADEQENYESLCNLHYSKTEKQKALEAFAIAMLIQRDKIIVDRFHGTDNPDKYIEDPESGVLRSLVSNVVDHYNNPETRTKITDFLSVTKQSMKKVSPKSTPPNEEILAATVVTPSSVNLSDGLGGRERDVEIAYEKLNTTDGWQAGVEMPDTVPRPLEEDNEFSSNP